MDVEEGNADSELMRSDLRDKSGLPQLPMVSFNDLEARDCS